MGVSRGLMHVHLGAHKGQKREWDAQNQDLQVGVSHLV